MPINPPPFKFVSIFIGGRAERVAGARGALRAKLLRRVHRRLAALHALRRAGGGLQRARPRPRVQRDARVHGRGHAAQARDGRQVRALQLHRHPGDVGAGGRGQLRGAAGQAARLRGALLARRPRGERQLLAQALPRPAQQRRHHRPRAGHRLLCARLRLQLGR